MRAPQICSQQTVVVPPDAGAKYLQDLLYQSDEWNSVYHSFRNSIEGMNGYAKDGAHEALADHKRRRVRGKASQSLFVALLCAAANVRKIDAYLDEQAAVASGRMRRLPRRRRTKAIGSWLPERDAVASSAAPDPPASA